MSAMLPAIAGPARRGNMTANADRNSVTAMMVNVSAMGPTADTIPFDKERRERGGESIYLRNFDGQRLRCTCPVR
jgi:hypothetical protein